MADDRRCRRNLGAKPVRGSETVTPVCDPVIKAELETTLRTYEDDNCSTWDMQPDGEYVRRHPAAGEARRGA